MGVKGPQAAEVTVLPAGAWATTTEPGAVYLGTIKIFNAEKGWGFIMGDEVRRLFGKDIFVHGRELGGHIPGVGEEVRFSVLINADGRPEATMVSMGEAAEAMADVFQASAAPPRMQSPHASGFAPY